MAKLENLRPGDRVWARPAQQRGTILRLMPRPELRQHPVVVRLNGTGTQRAFAPDELVLLGHGEQEPPTETEKPAEPSSEPGAPDEPSEPEQP